MSPYLRDIDHIGIAVRDLQEVIETFKTGFGLEPSFTEEIHDQQVRIAGYRFGNNTVEYFESVNPDSPLARFAEKHHNGVHHIAFRVEDIVATLEMLKEKGFRLIDDQPKPGANGSKIAFIHPSSFNGILIELCEL